MSVLNTFAQRKHAACSGGYRITMWHITEDEADAIADATTFGYVEKLRTLDHIRAGGVTLFGVPLRIKSSERAKFAPLNPGYYFARYANDNSADAWFIVSTFNGKRFFATGSEETIEAQELEFGRRIDIERERR